MYVAFNTEKKAYLSLDPNKRWSLTTDVAKAHRSETVSRLTNITKAQMRLIPNAWRIDEIAEPHKEETPVPTEEVVRQELIQEIHNKDNPVRGMWIASEEYKAVLGALNTLRKYGTNAYANQLRDRIGELNNEMVDLEHYIELTSLTLPRAWKVACRIKEVMQERRNIQQQIQLINRINSNLSTASLLEAEWEQPSDKVEKLYTPRTSYGEQMPWKDAQ